MKRLLLTAAVCLPLNVVFSQSADEVFAEGNQLYRDGRFSDAVARYESLLAQEYASPEVYFNLGNAYYRLGQIAKAILAYERALRMDPGDRDAAFNLRLANLRTADRIDPVPELFFVSWAKSAAEAIPMSLAQGLMIGLWSGLFLALALLNMMPGSSFDRMLRVGVLVCLIAVIPVGGLYAVQVQRTADRSEAIVTDRVVTAKASPDEQSADAFVIHEGLKVQLGDVVGEWVRITLADGKVGWVKTGVCERI